MGIIDGWLHTGDIAVYDETKQFAVVGVPDERLGESPRAYVIRKNANVSEQSIIDYVAERVAPHKKLGQGVMFVESLPKNQTGKILRRELKAQVFKGSFGY